MHCRTIPLAIALVALTATSVAAQKPQQKQIGTAMRHDVSPTLREMAQAYRGQGPADSKAPREIALRKPAKNQGAGKETFTPDVARQTELLPLTRAVATPAPTLSFDGLSDDDNAAVIGGRIVPPDTEGDVGPNHYMQWINLILAIWDKQGNLIFGPVAGNSFWSGFGGACETNNDGDPVIFYDHIADRWMISQFSINEGIMCIGVSTTGDPTGSYARYAFLVTPGGGNDYPKLGLWTDGAGQSAYHMSLRDFTPNLNTSAVAFDRDAMIAGSANVQFVKFTNPCATSNCVDAVQPPHLEGPTPAAGSCADYFVAWDDDFDGPLTGTDGYRNYQFCVDWNNPANATYGERGIAASSTGFNRAMCGFFQRGCIRQPRPGERLDPFDEATMYRAQFRSFGSHNSIVLNHTVDATGRDVAGVRWAELRQTTLNGPWTVFQDGTYSPDDDNRWMGSIAMDQDGNIALGYSVSSRNTFPSLRYTVRMAGDPLGLMTGGEATCVTGTGAQTGSFNRWGDYSTMSVDPVNGCTFWFTSEYYQTTGSFDFNTRICSFTIPGCGGGQGGPVCGNGTCEAGEDCLTCAADCPSSTGNTVCGNGVCEPQGGEDCLSCASDCAGKQNGKPGNRFCCGDGDGQNPVGCGDNRCTTSGFQCDPNAGGGGGFCCGDGVCDVGEEGICPIDCAP